MNTAHTPLPSVQRLGREPDAPPDPQYAELEARPAWERRRTEHPLAKEWPERVSLPVLSDADRAALAGALRADRENPPRFWPKPLPR